MQFIYIAIVILLAYLIGSIPMGLIVVKIWNGKDIRNIQSGRTGGTNAMRAAGFWAGLLTSILDIFKGASGIWIARVILPNNHFIEIIAGLIAIIGHNYSIYLIERNPNNKINWRGGAGGAPSAGGAMALWPPSVFIIVPMAAARLFGIGYASLATMSIPIITMIILSIRAYLGLSPWIYVLYGLIAEIILLWALRPNIKRLLNGTERLVGWRAKRAKQNSKENNMRSLPSEKAFNNS